MACCDCSSCACDCDCVDETGSGCGCGGNVRLIIDVCGSVGLADVPIVVADVDVDVIAGDMVMGREIVD